MRHEKTLRGRPGGGAETHLVAWSSLEDYELDDYLSALGQAFPRLTLTLVRTPTGELAERLRRRDLGERPPQLVFGTAATVLCEPEVLPLLAETRISGAPASGPEGRWVAASGFRNAVAVRVPALRERGLPAPETWSDLADPRYKSLFVFPDPAVSGAGTLALAGLVQRLDPDRAWAILAGLARGAASLPPSSWTCARAALDAATPIAVSVEIACLRLSDQSPSIRVIVPRDASAVELEGFAMLAGGAERALCQEILGWTVGDASQAIARRWRKVTLGGPGAASGALAGGSFTLDHGRAARDRGELVARFATLRGRSDRPADPTSIARSPGEGLDP